MSRILRIGLVLAVSSMMTNLFVSAQEPANSEVTEVTVYQAVVIGDGTIEGADKVSTIGPERPTRMEAEADEQQWKLGHAKSLRITNVKEKTVKTPVGKLKQAKEMLDKLKEAKEAVDKARKGPEERKPGDTLKEYRDRLKDTYQNAMNAKQNLTSMTGNIARKQFQEVNNLIDRFNQTRTDFGRQVQSAAGSPVFARYTSVLSQYPAIPRLTPQDLKGKLEPDTPESKFTVWVFKQEGGRWVKQEDRTLGTDDEKQARKYVADVKAVRGWTATSNLPERLDGRGGTKNTPASKDSLLGYWHGLIDNNTSTCSFSLGRDGKVYDIQTVGDEIEFVGDQAGTWSVQGRSVTIEVWPHGVSSALRFEGELRGEAMVGRYIQFAIGGDVSRTYATELTKAPYKTKIK